MAWCAFDDPDATAVFEDSDDNKRFYGFEGRGSGSGSDIDLGGLDTEEDVFDGGASSGTEDEEEAAWMEYLMFK